VSLHRAVPALPPAADRAHPHGAILLAPRANITDIDNDLTAWFSRDRSIRNTNAFGMNLAAHATLIIAARRRVMSLPSAAFEFIRRDRG
jgi:hypothetical protein